MYEVLRLMLSLLSALFIGWCALSVLFRSRPIFFIAEKMAIAYPFGLGIITVEMAILSAFGIKWSAASILAPWTPVVLMGLAIDFKGLKEASYAHPASEGGRLSFLEKFFIFGISFETIYAFFRALIKPIEAYDAIAIFAIKAKIFFLEKGIPRDFIMDFKDFVPHIEYPLHVPLSEAYVYTFLGSLNDILVKALFPLYYASMLVLFYYMVRKTSARKVALLFTFLLASVPQFSEHATTGYADLLLAFYFSASFFYLMLWIREGEGAHLVLSSIFSILCMWTKTDGLMLTGVNVAVACVYVFMTERKYVKGWTYYITVLLASMTAYLFVIRILSIWLHEDFRKLGHTNPLQLIANIKRVPLILYEYQIQFFGPKKWNIIWIVFLSSAVIYIKRIFENDIRPVTVGLLFIFCGYTAIYLLTPQGISWHLSKTASRFFIHFLPLVLVWLACLFKKERLDI